LFSFRAFLRFLFPLASPFSNCYQWFDSSSPVLLQHYPFLFPLLRKADRTGTLLQFQRSGTVLLFSSSFFFPPSFLFLILGHPSNSLIPFFPYFGVEYKQYQAHCSLLSPSLPLLSPSDKRRFSEHPPFSQGVIWINSFSSQCSYSLQCLDSLHGFPPFPFFFPPLPMTSTRVGYFHPFSFLPCNISLPCSHPAVKYHSTPSLLFFLLPPPPHYLPICIKVPLFFFFFPSIHFSKSAIIESLPFFSLMELQ